MYAGLFAGPTAGFTAQAWDDGVDSAMTPVINSLIYCFFDNKTTTCSFCQYFICSRDEGKYVKEWKNKNF